MNCYQKRVVFNQKFKSAIGCVLITFTGILKAFFSVQRKLSMYSFYNSFFFCSLSSCPWRKFYNPLANHLLLTENNRNKVCCTESVEENTCLYLTSIRLDLYQKFGGILT